VTALQAEIAGLRAENERYLSKSYPLGSGRTRATATGTSAATDHRRAQPADEDEDSIKAPVSRCASGGSLHHADEAPTGSQFISSTSLRGQLAATARISCETVA